MWRCEQADEGSGGGAEMVKGTQSFFFCCLGWSANDAGVGVGADAKRSGSDDRVRCGRWRSSRRAHSPGTRRAGQTFRAVADLLGHSSIAVTGDVYGHTSVDTARAAVDHLKGALGL